MAKVWDLLSVVRAKDDMDIIQSPACHGMDRPLHSCIARCYISCLSLVPVLVTVSVLLVVLGFALFRHEGPRWAESFIAEGKGLQLPLSAVGKAQNSYPKRVISALLFGGLVLRVAAALYPLQNAEALLASIPWAIAIFITVVRNQKITAFVVLAIMSCTLAIRLFLVFQTRPVHAKRDAPDLLEALIAFSVVVLALRIPLRNPHLPCDEISSVGDEPTNDLRSPEDNLTIWQFMTVSWMSPLISLGSTRKLNEEDIWSLGLEFQHKLLHDRFSQMTGSVTKRLLAANGLDLVITGSLAVLESLANFTSPILLQQLLKAMEDPTEPSDKALDFAVLSLVVRLIANQSSVFSLWYSRRCYERSRGEMLTMLHAKTLSRKRYTTSGQPRATPLFESTEVNALPPETSMQSPFRKRLKTIVRSIFRCTRGRISTIKEPASTGKIYNLMRNDVYEVSQRFWEFQTLITTPLGLILSISLIWKLIGWPCLIGAITVITAQMINFLLVRIQISWEQIRRTATDEKIEKISEFVTAIRHLRWYSWQDYWQDTINKARQRELNLRVITSLWGILISFTNNLSSGMFPVVAFWAYASVAGRPLRVDIAFPALQLFSMLEGSLREIPRLVTVLLNANVAMGRIEDFMCELDKTESKDETTETWNREDTDHVRDNAEPSDRRNDKYTLSNASFAWSGGSDLVLRNVNITCPVGITVIHGKVGAGKTALLQAMLGELDIRSGAVQHDHGPIAYCSQAPWLQSMSIRENILFFSPYDGARYKHVLEACALTHDLSMFKNGDLSDIGENGVGLSGGQKMRVALARAVYSRAQILLLDDPLSALDQQTAETIVTKCFSGPLMNDRTVVLVTHRVDICWNVAALTIEIVDGTARVHKISATEPQDEIQACSSESEARIEGKDLSSNIVPEKFLEEEHRAHGGVKAVVYWEYIKAGKLKWWAVLVCILTLYRLLAVGEIWFLKQWSEAYGDRSVRQIAAGTSRHSFDISGLDRLLKRLPSPEANIKPWLYGFLAFAIAQSMMFVISQSFMLLIIYSAGRQMFRAILESISNATFRFYDVTPLGRLMNRMTSDIATVDGNISQQFQDAAFLTITWVSSVVIIASVTPVFLAFSVILTAAFVMIFLRFLPTSQSLRRLEMVSLSPLMSNFGTLLAGLDTVRAFAVQSHFQDRVISVVDAFQKNDHFFWSLQAWLMYRFDALSASSTFLITLLALYTGVSPGLTAFVLTAASQFVSSTHALCKRYGQLQMDFVSVERVVEMLHLEQEPKGEIDPPAWWPSYTGDIVCQDVTIRYAPHLDPSLKDVSFRIPGGSTTAILGRTGSGKSTLALALLATTRPESGSLFIDGVDVSRVNTQALRSRITFLAQEPVLFPGSLRQNLDPLDEFLDDACEAVLHRVFRSHDWNLEMHVDACGSNLSQGQRQLVGLARAVLRRSPIIILDEATASIDMETAEYIQQVLRDELKQSTIITIAHRLEAVKNADYQIVLQNGKIAYQGPTPVQAATASS